MEQDKKKNNKKMNNTVFGKNKSSSNAQNVESFPVSSGSLDQEAMLHAHRRLTAVRGCAKCHQSENVPTHNDDESCFPARDSFSWSLGSWIGLRSRYYRSSCFFSVGHNEALARCSAPTAAFIITVRSVCTSRFVLEQEEEEKLFSSSLDASVKANSRDR